jgi:hypothetical protein
MPAIFATNIDPWASMPEYVSGTPSDRSISIAHPDRLSHVAIVGKTRMGKSTLLLRLMCADLDEGMGFGLLDPHGDLAEAVLDRVPPSRVNDVIYFNPADLAYPVPLNVFDAVDETQHHLIADGLISIFKRIWKDTWGARLEYILANAAFALIEQRERATLADIPRLLADDDYRAGITRNLKNPAARRFWRDEYAGWTPAFRAEALAPLQNKVGKFLMSPLTRNIVAQRKNLFDLRRVMDEGKILIANLAKGALGEEASALLGALLTTRFMLAAFSRQDTPEAERRPFHLYLDEFQNFATESTMSTLSEAGKYRLGLTLAHQYLAQLPDDIRAALFGNVGTLISFRLGADDAAYLAREFAPVSTNDLMELPRGRIFLKLQKDGATTFPFPATTLAPPPAAGSRRAQIIDHSRRFYARPRAVVERGI